MFTRMPRPPAQFRINSKSIFLTYPQCHLSKEECLQQIINLQYPIKPVYIRVCQEEHQDDTPHLHCLIQFEGRFQTRNQRFFDLISPSRSAPFHPNVQPTKSCSAVQSYIAKGGNYTDWGTFRPDGRNKTFADKMSDLYTAALATGDKMKALEVIQKGDPRGYCLNRDRLLHNFEKHFQKPPEAYEPEFRNFAHVPVDLLEWAADNIRPEGTRPIRPRSLILEGPSRTGKTCWARSLGPHNYYMGHLDMARHNDDAWYNVIDDVDPQYLKHWMEFIGANKGWQSNCKYSKPKLIKGGIPCIVLCNDGPKASYKEFLDKDDNASLKRWTLRNADFYFISEPLFADGDADDATEREASARHSEEEQETEEVPS
ncbi:replication associated protein [Persimmon circular DNA virus]|nr:replication associated protein [Persimmon circular DNA virus]